MGTFLRVSIIRTIVYLGLYWGPLILGNYHIVTTKKVPADLPGVDIEHILLGG